MPESDANQLLMKKSSEHIALNMDLLSSDTDEENDNEDEDATEARQSDDADEDDESDNEIEFEREPTTVFHSDCVSPRTSNANRPPTPYEVDDDHMAASQSTHQTASPDAYALNS